jgi:hypothetical protein
MSNTNEILLCYSGHIPAGTNTLKLNEMHGKAIKYPGKSIADFGSTQLQLFWIEPITQQPKNVSICSEHPIWDAYQKLKEALKTLDQPPVPITQPLEPALESLHTQLGRANIPPIGFAQLGSDFNDHQTALYQASLHTAGVTNGLESTLVSTVQRINTFNAITTPCMKTKINTIYRHAHTQKKPIFVLAGTVGAAHYGRDQPKTAEALRRMTPTTMPSFEATHDPKQDPFNFVSRALTTAYPNTDSIVDKLIALGVLSEEYRDHKVMIGGFTAGGSNPGCFVVFENGEHAGFELDTTAFKALRALHQTMSDQDALGVVQSMEISSYGTTKAGQDTDVKALIEYIKTARGTSWSSTIKVGLFAVTATAVACAAWAMQQPLCQDETNSSAPTLL